MRLNHTNQCLSVGKKTVEPLHIFSCGGTTKYKEVASELHKGALLPFTSLN